MKIKSIMVGLSVLFCGLVIKLEAASLPQIVRESTRIVSARQGSASPIPASELAMAKGVAIVDITKGGFVIGGAGGSGVVFVKKSSGLGWNAPIPVRFSGGSFGAQVGGANTKAIVLLNSDHAVKVFTKPGKLAWNAKATGTAGADEKTEQKGGLFSDLDVRIYQETEGLYGGATFGGTSISIIDDALQDAYGEDMGVQDVLEGKAKTPDYAARLVGMLDGKR
jgi:SH3 domain-containing YSC84-like protein 1